MEGVEAVSYTHLDVYKRQVRKREYYVNKIYKYIGFFLNRLRKLFLIKGTPQNRISLLTSGRDRNNFQILQKNSHLCLQIQL